MNTLAHYAVFWSAGLLVGVLFGSMLGRKSPSEPPHPFVGSKEAPCASRLTTALGQVPLPASSLHHMNLPMAADPIEREW